MAASDTTTFRLMEVVEAYVTTTLRADAFAVVALFVVRNLIEYEALVGTGLLARLSFSSSVAVFVIAVVLKVWALRCAYRDLQP